VTSVEKTGEREVTFTFDAPGNRELPQIVGQITVLPKHWWEGTDASGAKRNVGATTLEPPLGCGPYRIKSFTAGRSVVYERVKDYWGKDLNIRVGRDNFDEIRFEYFRDPTVALEGFKGDQVDWRSENSALFWATRYDFPAVKEKRVVLEEFDILNIGLMQGMIFNTRREKFRDPRVRRAFNYAYDFEEMNKQIFFGQYMRIRSYFEGSELAWYRPSAAPPAGKELAILETVRNQVPPEVFTTPYTNPVGGSAEAMRNNLREATRLLREAGYQVRDHKLVNAKTGEPLTVELLSNDPGIERIILFYKPSLERLGIEVSVRTVDDAQYQNRLRQWDYDMIVEVLPQSLSPGNEQRDFWSSKAANEAGSHNYAGIKDPAIDALIDKVIFATSREDLVAATKALDRVLMWGHYVVPQYTYRKIRGARWDRFGRPSTLPKYGLSGFPTVWWWDAEKAAKVGTRS
jgi:microcin C transport system substrate-binding protein